MAAEPYNCVISCEELTVSYPLREGNALHAVNIQLQAGEIVILAGGNGSGKSTLLHCLAGLIPGIFRATVKGSCRVNLQPAMVLQDSDVFLLPTPAEELAFVLENQGLSPAEQRQRFEKIITLFHLEPLLNRSMHTLSGGERQRLALAAALVAEPRLLLLDEPLAQLDTAFAAEFEQAEARFRQVQVGPSPEEIKQAENRLQEAEINLEHLHRQYERAKILFEDGFIAQQELEEIQKAIILAEIKVEDARQHLSLTYKKFTAEEIASARAQVEQARANLKEAELRLQDARVTSPIDGTVASVNVNPGDSIGREGGNPLFTIIDLKRLEVLVYVDEIEIGKIAPGQKAVTRMDAFPGDEFVGTVSSISPLPIKEGTAIYFLVTVELEEPDKRLRPWLTADTEIYLEEKKNVLTPMAALPPQKQMKMNS